MSSLWEWWLNNTRKRPWRSFLYLWLTLVALFILIGIFGFHHDTFPDTPPIPESIDYQRLIDQGGFYGSIEVEIDEDIVPTFDPTIQYEGTTDTSPYIYHPETGEPWLTWQRITLDGSFGWPFPIVDWYSHIVWDVTDPTKPYPLADGYWATSSWFDLGSNLAPVVRRISSDKARITNFRFRAFEFLAVAMPLEIICAILVWITWFIVHGRRKRRLRKGACLTCGQLLGPNPRPTRCPECGIEVDNTVKLNTRRSRFGWLFIGILVFLFIFTIVASILLIDEYPQKPIAEQMKRVELGDQTAKAQNVTQWRVIKHFDGACGFPFLFVNVERQQFFIVSPNKKPYSAIPKQFGLGFSLYPDSDYISWSFAHGDPGYMTTITFPWKMVIVQIGATELLAFILALLLTIVTWPVRRLRRRRTRASCSS